MNLSRRHFLATSSTAALASTLPGVAAAADERFTIGLSMYSLRALIKEGSLTALDYPAFAAEQFGIHEIDVWEGGLPKDKLDDLDYISQLKAKAEAQKSHIFLWMSGALNADPKQSNLETIKASLPRAKAAGSELVRVFLRAPGKDAVAGAAASVEALKPLADASAEHDLTIAIEPGSSELSQKGAFLVEVMEQLKHPHCKLMPDFGKQKGNVYDGTQVMMPHTVSVSCKMHSFDEEGNQPDFDYPRLLKIIADGGYQGILAIEWEGSKLKPIPGVKASKALIEKSIAALQA